jgi:hypothetical protein
MAKTKLGVGWHSSALLRRGRGGGGAAAAATAGGVPPGAAPAAEEPITYSIKGQFAGATVLLTGASGYIGSVVLEQLLRTTDVAEVHLLLRARRGTDPSERVAALLGSSLFHMVRRRGCRGVGGAGGGRAGRGPRGVRRAPRAGGCLAARRGG